MRLISTLLALLICFIPAFSQDTENKAEIAKQSQASVVRSTDPAVQAAERNMRKHILDSINSGCHDCREKGDLVYDFSCKRLYQLDGNLNRNRITNLRQIKVLYGQEFRFSIINVNRYLYDINFRAEDVYFGSEPSPLFESAFLGKKLPGSDSEAAKLPNADPEMVVDGNEARLSIATLTAQFKLIYDAFTNSYNKLLDDELEAYSYCTVLDCDCGKIKLSTFLEQLDRVKQQYIIDSTDFVIRIKKLSAKPTADLLALKGAARLLDVLFESIRPITHGSLMKLVLFSNNQSRDHLTYIAPPVYPRGNRLEFGFRIGAKENKGDSAWKFTSMPIYTDSIGLDLPVRRKPFVSFSSGLFGVGNHFRNANHSWQTQLDSGIIDNDSQYKLVKGKRSPSPVGFAALANIGVTAWDNVMLAASLGVGLTIEEKLRAAYLGGLTIGIGDEKQFNVTAGFIAMRVRVFDNDAYTYDNLYKEKETIDYREVLKTGWFVAVTYSVFTPTNRKGLFSRSK